MIARLFIVFVVVAGLLVIAWVTWCVAALMMQGMLL